VVRNDIIIDKQYILLLLTKGVEVFGTFKNKEHICICWCFCLGCRK